MRHLHHGQKDIKRGKGRRGQGRAEVQDVRGGKSQELGVQIREGKGKNGEGRSMRTCSRKKVRIEPFGREKKAEGKKRKTLRGG